MDVHASSPSQRGGLGTTTNTLVIQIVRVEVLVQLLLRVRGPCRPPVVRSSFAPAEQWASRLASRDAGAQLLERSPIFSLLPVLQHGLQLRGLRGRALRQGQHRGRWRRRRDVGRRTLSPSVEGVGGTPQPRRCCGSEFRMHGPRNRWGRGGVAPRPDAVARTVPVLLTVRRVLERRLLHSVLPVASEGVQEKNCPRLTTYARPALRVL